METPAFYLRQRLGIDLIPTTAALVDERASVACFPRGRILLQEGDRATAVFYLLKGVVRGYYHDTEGNDVTKCFSSEGEFFSSEGLRTGGPSSFSIESLEECQCIRLPYDLLDELIRQSEPVNNLVNKLYTGEVGRLEKRAQDLMLLDAQGRYEAFCQEYPGLLQRVPLKHIASYIGIRPASLSRLRSRQKKCR